MAIRLLTSSLICLLSVGIASCGHDDHEHDGHDHGAGTATGALCPQGSTLTYEAFGKAFMDRYCTRCHSASVKGAARQGAPGTHDLDTVEQVRKLALEIDRGSAAGPNASNARMPVGMPVPTDEERRRLGEWLACGAP